MGPCYMFAASWANCRPGEARRMVRESGVFGRGFGRAPGDFRRSFRMEWLRIEFWTHRRKPFSKPTEELRRLAPARDGGIRWILGGLRGLPQPPISLRETPLVPPLHFFSARCARRGVGKLCPGSISSKQRREAAASHSLPLLATPCHFLPLLATPHGVFATPPEAPFSPGRNSNSRQLERVQVTIDSSLRPDWSSEGVCRPELETDRRGAANGTPLYVVPGGSFPDASGSPPDPP